MIIVFRPVTAEHLNIDLLKNQFIKIKAEPEHISRENISSNNFFNFNFTKKSKKRLIINNLLNSSELKKKDQIQYFNFVKNSSNDPYYKILKSKMINLSRSDRDLVILNVL